MRYFTHYWNRAENIQYAGEPLNHMASNQFRRRGVEVGDVVYCVSRVNGQMVLVGRMQVGKIQNSGDAGRESAQSIGFEERSDQCIAARGTGTPINFERLVPLAVASKLSFNGKELTIDADDPRCLDRQTLRGIRQLDAASAVILDAIIDSEVRGGIERTDLNDVVAEEGWRVPAYHLRLERDPRIIAAKKQQVLLANGCMACECCDFDFERFYGDLGHGYAECHHRTWLAKTPPESFRLTRTADLAIVCANCHRMLHKDQQLTAEKLRRHIDRRGVKERS